MNAKTNEVYSTEYQQYLLKSIFSFSQVAGLPQEGLEIYQNNLQMTAHRTLSISYPVIESMIGKEALHILTRRLLSEYRPRHGDWAEWGEQLSVCLQRSELHEDYPYLADIASLEWAFHQATRSAANVFDADSLSRLSDTALESIYCVLSPSVKLLSSEFPLYQIWRAHRGLKPGEQPDVTVLENIMKNISNAERCVAYQHNGIPSVEPLSESQFDWMEGLEQGLSIASLLDIYPSFDFVTWLSDAIRKEWITSLK